MIRSKANFRAARESVGLTQAALASELGVQVRSVKRWESPEAPQRPPADAWRILQDAYDAQWEAVEAAVAKAEQIRAERGEPAAVRIRYWPDAESYLERSTDSALGVAGDWRMANANARAAALALRGRGFAVEFVDGGDPGVCVFAGSLV